MKFHLVTTPAKHEQFLRRAAMEKNAGAVGFDTEAVGVARRYSQANDKPFMNLKYTALQGFSIALADENVYYYPLRHKNQNAKWVWADEAWEAIREREVWAHNVKFDASMMESDGYDIKQVPWMDSMLAAWLRFSKTSGIGLKVLAKELLDRESPAWTGSLIDKRASDVLDYVCHDALNTLQLGQLLYGQLTEKQQRALRDLETPLAVELGRMERGGIRLDLEKLQSTMGSLAAQNLCGEEGQWAKLTGVQKDPETGEEYKPNPNSAKSLQEFFRDGTWEPYGLTSDGKFKTGRDVMEYNEKHANTPEGRKLARLCLEIRGARKVKGTYLEGFYEEIRQWPDRKLHPELNQLGTRTGRFSAANPNIQNQLSHGEYAPLLKKCYVPEEGWSFVSADYAQIELRLFAELAGGSLLQAYLDGADLHTRTGDTLRSTRDVGKTFNFGFMIYGGGPQKAAREFGWTLDQARENIAAIQKEYPEAGAFRRKVIDIVKARGPVPWVATKTGRIRLIPELRPLEWKRMDPEAYANKAAYTAKKYNINPTETIQWGRDQGMLRLDVVIRSGGERIAVNTIIQGSAADLAKWAIVDFAARTDRKHAHMVTMVHDELLATCRTEFAESVAETLRYSMETAGPALGFKVPIIAEPKIGANWYDAH